MLILGDSEGIEIFKEKILPQFDALAKDSCPEVRAYCASILPEVSKIK